jgi:hypothetical protein
MTSSENSNTNYTENGHVRIVKPVLKSNIMKKPVTPKLLLLSSEKDIILKVISDTYILKVFCYLFFLQNLSTALFECPHLKPVFLVFSF